MCLVPIITEAFLRLVLDNVGPFRATWSGNRFIMTALCPATKFPEAVPLRELSSANVVEALLSSFARIGFLLKIESDNGSFFTRVLTTTFFKKSGIKTICSSMYRPESNSVKRMHSVRKLAMRALCFEHKKGCEACLPVTMFALMSASHQTTVFCTAKLVYERAMRSSLRLLRESIFGSRSTRLMEYSLFKI